MPESPQTPEIKDPYAKDKLGNRKDCGTFLKNFIEDANGINVISLNGGWGTGKTTFLKWWQKDLDQSGFKTIYFSAWEDDYCEKPLVSLIGQLEKQLGKEFYSIIDSLKSATKNILFGLPSGLAKLTTLGVVDTKADDYRNPSEIIFEQYKAAGEAINELKNHLTELASKSRKLADKKDKSKPLVVIIDELDRCRPLFAIEMLEQIKHIFNIPGMVFVLGIDREQLGHSIQCVYGQGMDSNGYLRRFIDIEFNLPKGNHSTFYEHLYSTHLSSKIDSIGCKSIQLKACEELFKVFDMSLRDQEHCFKVFKIAPTDGGIDEDYLLPLAFMIIVKIVKPEAYAEISKVAFDGPDFLINIIAECQHGREFLATDMGMLLQARLNLMSPMQLISFQKRRKSINLNVENLRSNGNGNIQKAMGSQPVTYKISGIALWPPQWEGQTPKQIITAISERIEMASLMA